MKKTLLDAVSRIVSRDPIFISRVDSVYKFRLPGFSNCWSAGEILEGATIEKTAHPKRKNTKKNKRIEPRKNRTQQN